MAGDGGWVRGVCFVLLEIWFGFGRSRRGRGGGGMAWGGRKGSLAFLLIHLPRSWVLGLGFRVRGGIPTIPEISMQ